MASWWNVKSNDEEFFSMFGEVLKIPFDMLNQASNQANEAYKKYMESKTVSHFQVIGFKGDKSVFEQRMKGDKLDFHKLFEAHADETDSILIAGLNKDGQLISKQHHMFDIQKELQAQRAREERSKSDIERAFQAQVQEKVKGEAQQDKTKPHSFIVVGFNDNVVSYQREVTPGESITFQQTIQEAKEKGAKSTLVIGLNQDREVIQKDYRVFNVDKEIAKEQLQQEKVTPLPPTKERNDPEPDRDKGGI